MILKRWLPAPFGPRRPKHSFFYFYLLTLLVTEKYLYFNKKSESNAKKKMLRVKRTGIFRKSNEYGNRTDIKITFRARCSPDRATFSSFLIFIWFWLTLKTQYKYVADFWRLSIQITKR